MNAAAATTASTAMSHGTRLLERSRLKLRIASSLCSSSSPSSNPPSNTPSELGAEGTSRDVGVRRPPGLGAGTTAKPLAFSARST